MTSKTRLFVVFVWSAALAAALFFLVLQGRRTLFLEIDLTTSRPGAGNGQVWWTSGTRPFLPSDSTSFRLSAGRQKISVRLPVEIDTLQIRPGPPGGAVTIHGISLRTPVAKLRRWGGVDAFTGWREAGGLTGFGVADGVLKMRVVGNDASFQADDVGPLRDAVRRRAHLRIALLGGLLAGAVETLGLALLFGRRRTAAGAAEPERAASPAPKGAWWLLAGTTALCLVVAWFVGRSLLKKPAHGVFSETGDYSLVFVDHLGQRLSEKDGGLKLRLDPYALYRSLPGQKTTRFSIDMHGYRGGFDETDGRPRIFVLGGSAAFGFGLDSDADLFTARLAKRRPGWQVVNAAVVGYLSGQELSELVHHGDAVKPAAVVVYDGWNDLYVPLLAATRFRANGLGVGFNWDVFQMVQSRLRLLTLAGAADDAARGTPEPVPDLVRRITATWSSNLSKIKSACASRGVPLLVVLQPWLGSRRGVGPAPEAAILRDWTSVGERADPILYDTFVAQARQFLTAERIPFVDLHGSGPFVTTPRQLFTDVVHMVPEGHELVAAGIEKPLADLMGGAPEMPPAARNR